MRYRTELLCCVILEYLGTLCSLGEGEVRSVELAARKTLASAIIHAFWTQCGAERTQTL